MSYLIYNEFGEVFFKPFIEICCVVAMNKYATNNN